MIAISRIGVWMSAAALVGSLAGCRNTVNGMKEDARENRERAAAADVESREKADRAGDALERAGAATADAANSAVHATREVVGTAGRATDAAIQTMDVKAALVADKQVDTSGIDVDTYGDTKTVVLKGHVPTVSQKARAEDIARGKAIGYKIENQLLVQ